jgi:hypothetical protein
MFNSIKSLFGAGDKKGSESKNENIAKPKLITHQTIDDAKSKFTKDYIDKFEWRKSPFKKEYDEDKNIFTIIYYVQIYNIINVLKNREYINTIIDKYNKFSYIDDYGDLITDKFDKEKISFVRHKWPLLKSNYEKSIDEYYLNFASKHGYMECLLFKNEDDNFDVEQIASRIQSAVYDYTREIEHIKANSPEKMNNETAIDPIEFENFIADKFRDLYWEVVTTKVTGDQGADLICQKDGWYLVVQCKLYSQPVGNSAVQEIYAAKEHYSANFAAVVTNSTFTKSAQELAQSIGVFLVNERDIRWFDTKLFTLIDEQN